MAILARRVAFECYFTVAPNALAQSSLWLEFSENSASWPS